MKQTIQQNQSTIEMLQDDRDNWRKNAESNAQKLKTSERLRASVEEQLKKAKTEDNLHLLVEFKSMEIAAGSFTRLTMFDPEFHARYPDVCQDMYGFESFQEALEIVQATMTEIKIEYSNAVSYDKKKRVIHFEPFTEFEELMIAKMFFHTGWKRQKIGVIVNQTDRRRIGEFITKWAPRWGKVGQYLSMLDIDEDYLTHECPIQYVKEGMLRTAVLLDGKDYLTDTLRSDKTHARTQQSHKSGAAAAREMCCSTPMGLTFLYTRLVGGRIEENDLVKILGGDGLDYVPLETFKGIANSSRKASLWYRTAIDEYKEKRNAINLIEDDEEEEEEGDEPGNSDNDGNGSDASEDEYNNNNEEEEENEEQDSEDASMNGIEPEEQLNFDNGVNDDKSEPTVALSIELMEQELKEFKRTKEGQIKSATVRSGDQLEEEAKKFIREQSPTCDPVEKLAQYEMHERLGALYRDGKLKHNTLSFYLEAMRKKRRKWLHYMCSSMADDSWDDPSVELPEVGLAVGLTMIPKDWRVLADKGFTYVTRHFPNFNAIDTPPRLGKRKYGRYSSAEGKSSKSIIKLRYTCEVVFRRVTEEEVLRDRISYHNFSVLPHVQAWAHAHNNLSGPLAIPLRAPENYFPQEKNAKKRK